MNSVLDWYFYEMHKDYLAHPEWWLRDSNDSEPVYCPGDKHFNPPKGGMLAFDHANPAVRSWWESVCLKAVASGVVDGCFSDSSQPDTHGTGRWLNASYHDKFEQGKVDTMAALTTKFGEPSCRRRRGRRRFLLSPPCPLRSPSHDAYAAGGRPGKPYGASTGVLIGKKPDQLGINAFQIVRASLPRQHVADYPIPALYSTW